jgi:hypothetical protein
LFGVPSPADPALLRRILIHKSSYSDAAKHAGAGRVDLAPMEARKLAVYRP